MAAEGLSLQSPPVKYGIIGGVVYIFAVTILYVLGIPYYINPFIKFFIFIVICIFPIRAGLEVKSQNDGYIKFTRALFQIFLCFLIIEAIYVSYSWVLPTVIDPELSEKIVDYQKQQIEQGEGMFGIKMSEEQKEDAIRRIEEAGGTPKLQWILLGLLIYALIDFTISLIAAAIIKKEPPPTVPTLDAP